MKLVAFLLLVPGVLGGCAAFKDTPAQQLAWERWRSCDRFASVQLDRIEPNGRVWVHYSVDGERARWQDCMRAAYRSQQAAGRLAPGAQPALEAHELKSLVRFAYLTDAPPQPGTSLRSTVLSNMPPETKAFRLGQAPSFFYALTQVGRVVDVHGRWIGPSGKPIRTIQQTLNQAGFTGAWVWETQTLSADELTEGGDWSVELLLDGRAVGRYPFRVDPR